MTPSIVSPAGPGAQPRLRGGLDLGGTKIQAAVLGATYEAVGQAKRPTPTSGGPADVAAEMIATLREAAEQAGVETSALAGIGVGSPGEVDEDTGVVAVARNLPNWEDPFPLAETLADALGAPVAVGNDVDIATEAEARLGAGRDVSSVLGVFWGTGVGGGLWLDGRLWHGRGTAGEIGHMVVKQGGRRCPCGRRGCMEAYAGRKALEGHARKLVRKGRKTDLFDLMKKYERPNLTSSIWERALDREDGLATELIDEAVEALGTGVASACNLLDPDAVIIGGGLGSRFGKPMVERIADAMLPHLFEDDQPPIVRVAALGDLGGATGAVLLSESVHPAGAAVPRLLVR